MKILHVIDSGGLYGAEIMLLTLMDEQRSLGLTPILCSIGHKKVSEKPIETEAQKRGFAVEKFRFRNGPNFPGALKIVRFSKEHQIDLIHSHGYKGNIILGLLPRAIQTKPFVCTLHGWTSTDRLTRMKIYEWLDRTSLSFADSVVLVNRAMFSHFQGRDQTRFTVIENGIPSIDFDKNRPSSDPILEFCSQGFIVGSIGRLSREKGYPILIRAVHLLLEKGLEIKLVILGEGRLRIELEQQIEELNIGKHVMLPGYRDKAQYYIPSFDLYAISSMTEGLPITLLEAMQSQRPVVSTKVGGIPEVLEQGKAGLLVPPNEVKPLADAILRLYNEPETGKLLANRAKEIVESKYSSKQMALEYQNLYEKVCRREKQTNK